MQTQPDELPPRRSHQLRRTLMNCDRTSGRRTSSTHTYGWADAWRCTCPSLEVMHVPGIPRVGSLRFMLAVRGAPATAPRRTMECGRDRRPNPGRALCRPAQGPTGRPALLRPRVQFRDPATAYTPNATELWFSFSQSAAARVLFPDPAIDTTQFATNSGTHAPLIADPSALAMASGSFRGRPSPSLVPSSALFNIDAADDWRLDRDGFNFNAGAQIPRGGSGWSIDVRSPRACAEAKWPSTRPNRRPVAARRETRRRTGAEGGRVQRHPHAPFRPSCRRRTRLRFKKPSVEFGRALDQSSKIVDALGRFHRPRLEGRRRRLGR